MAGNKEKMARQGRRARIDATALRPRARVFVRRKARQEDGDFQVVGIGASAGGLEAFKKLLDALPADSGMAFILIQHLDPTHESMMVDLLAGHTTMKVQQAADGMPLERDHVYVIPPGAYLSIRDGALRLSQPPGAPWRAHAVRLLPALAGRGMRRARHLRDPVGHRRATAASG